MKVSKRDKKLLTAGAVAIAIFCVLKFGLFPLYDTLIERRKEIALKEQTREKYLKFLSEQADFQKRMTGRGKEEGLGQQSLLKGETTSLAAADIQKVVDEFAKESKVDMQSVKVLDSDTKDDFVVIPVQIAFSSDLTRFVKFVRGIETDRKLLTIPELKIRVKNEQKPQDVSVTLTVAGYMKKGENKK
jgi:flagellar biosynthesis/type III secretory pathway M-ring protein FliF/YscJ